MDDYLRLKKTFGSAELYIPYNIDNLFLKYGKEELIKKNRAIYERIRRVKDSQAKRIIDLMSRHNCGVEHEILIVNQD